MNELVFLLICLCAGLGGRLLAFSADRDRIRECIQRNGGKVLSIMPNPLERRWFGNAERIYDVRYHAPHGKVCEATCKTKMFAGVSWIATAPPGLYPGQSQENTYASGETITCLKCGATIPTGHSRCPKCGWSYMAGHS